MTTEVEEKHGSTPNVITRLDGKVSRYTGIRLTEEELEFLRELEWVVPEGQRRGIGPAVHRLIEHARGWDVKLAGPLREWLKAEGMTVEGFAELAGIELWAVRDILTLATRQPDHETVKRIRRVIGDD